MGALKAATGAALVRTPLRVVEALRRYSEVQGLVVEAGFPGELRDVKAKGDDGPNPPSVLQVATWNEYGTATAPPRPFMRQTITRHQRTLRDALGRAVYDYGRQRGSQGLDRIAARLGVMLRGAIQETIVAGDFVPNADLTKMIKGSRPRKTFREALAALRAGEPVPEGTRPLIDTGQMRQSVRWRARLAGRVIAQAGGGRP
jgi:hypothetical protein